MRSTIGQCLNGFEYRMSREFPSFPHVRMAKTIRQEHLTFSIQAQNLFNLVNNDLPVGNLSSLFFGQSTATLGGYGEGNRSSAGNRRIKAQIKAEF